MPAPAAPGMSGAILALGDAMRCRAGSAQERTLLGLPLRDLWNNYADLI
ncbi:MAG: hypothetical protein F6J93_20140 [Oscillatoria sp. SIO1A7]|nr:hypothetical protein [Oscillatoria sp. SIO1A7]